jgi:hypothetical protein
LSSLECSMQANLKASLTNSKHQRPHCSIETSLPLDCKQFAYFLISEYQLRPAVNDSRSWCLRRGPWCRMPRATRRRMQRRRDKEPPAKIRHRGRWPRLGTLYGEDEGDRCPVPTGDRIGRHRAAAAVAVRCGLRGGRVELGAHVEAAMQRCNRDAQRAVTAAGAVTESVSPCHMVCQDGQVPPSRWLFVSSWHAGRRY